MKPIIEIRHYMMKKLLLMLGLLPILCSAAESADSSFTYRPNFHATIRTRFEYAPQSGEYRFQLRNARATLSGNILREIDYFLNADLCDAGKMKMLDAWVRFKDSHGFSVQGGQFRIPFGTDPFRAPHQYLFNNRSFIGKQLCNYRAVGLKLGYEIPKTPLTLDFGVFSPSTITDHTPWQKKFTWAGEAKLKLGDVKLSGGMASVMPAGMRANMAGGCLSWKSGRWIAEGEYMHKHYVHGAHVPTHAWNIFGSYRFPVKMGIFNYMSAQARFDGMTAHSSLSPDESGSLKTDDPARKRITAGMTISHFRSANLFADIRLDYEKYFYRSGYVPNAHNGDKLTLELVLRF